MPRQVRMKKKKVLSIPSKVETGQKTKLLISPSSFGKKLGYPKLFYHHEQIRLSQSIIILFLFYLSKAFFFLLCFKFF